MLRLIDLIDEQKHPQSLVLPVGCDGATRQIVSGLFEGMADGFGRMFPSPLSARPPNHFY